MTIPEVEWVMGTPTRIVTDNRRFVEELPTDRTCATLVSQILVYGRGDGVRVGVNAGGIVKCVVNPRDAM